MNADLIPFVTKNSYLIEPCLYKQAQAHTYVQFLWSTDMHQIVPSTDHHYRSFQHSPPCPCSQPSAVQIPSNYIRLKHLHINIAGLR
jgi:hypothetical protein